MVDLPAVVQLVDVGLIEPGAAAGGCIMNATVVTPDLVDLVDVGFLSDPVVRPQKWRRFGRGSAIPSAMAAHVMGGTRNTQWVLRGGAQAERRLWDA